jgi:hypothetical protein
MRMHLLVGAGCLFALGTYAHAGPIHTQDGQNSMTKPNGDAGITRPLQERPAAASEGDKPSTDKPTSASARPNLSPGELARHATN